MVVQKASVSINLYFNTSFSILTNVTVRLDVNKKQSTTNNVMVREWRARFGETVGLTFAEPFVLRDCADLITEDEDDLVHVAIAEHVQPCVGLPTRRRTRPFHLVKYAASRQRDMFLNVPKH